MSKTTDTTTTTTATAANLNYVGDISGKTSPRPFAVRCDRTDALLGTHVCLSDSVALARHLRRGGSGVYVETCTRR